jgi:TolB-like protein/Tfp pilus assembly protein PilF
MTEGDTLFSRAFADLRRRKVFRVAAGYAVVAWLVIEVASVVIPALRLPEWLLTAVVITALAGFPITLLLAWLFDLTPDGVVRTRPVPDGAPEVHRVARRGIDFVVIAVLLAIIGYLVFDQGLTGQLVARSQSIAVLPFVDLSESGDNEYFSDGISEELLNSLVGIEGLRVAARTSSFAFKGRNEDVRSIGAKLNVRTVLEGSVRRAGDQVRITAQLINVDDGFQIWSDTYERRLDDIFAIQDEIARSIVDALKLTLIGEQQGLATVASTADIRAYDLYLLGRHHWHQRSGESLARALDLFQQAIDIDPNFALAYTGVADTYLLMDGYGDMSTEDAMARAEPAVARALALDGNLAEAYASLGLLRLNQEDLTSAELALRSAVTLNPNYSMAHMWLGLVLDRTTGPVAARQEYRSARQLDPLHPVINRNLANAYASTGQPAEAARILEEMIDLDPANATNYFMMSRMQRLYGRLDDSARWAWWGSRNDESGMNHVALSMALAALGDFERAERYLDQAGKRMPRKIETIGARMGLYLSQGRLEELVELSRSLDVDDEANEKAAWLGGLVVSGIAEAFGGDPEEGADRLQRAVDAAQRMGMLPSDRVGLLACLAHVRKELGRYQESEAAIETGLALVAESRKEGWADPQLPAWQAILLYMSGDESGARRAFRDAVQEGWRDYFAVSRFPPVREFLEDPELATDLRTVMEDIDRMAARVADLESLPPRRTAVARVDLRPDTSNNN